MKKTLVIISIFLLWISCNSNKSVSKQIDNDFGKSFKEDKGEEFNVHLDSLTNIYSNFKYHVAFDAPDNWKTDVGVSEHTVFRTFQKDSSITFSINVIDMNLTNNKLNSFEDIWDFYQKNKEQLDTPIISFFENQMNTNIKGYNCKKVFIKNKVCLKRMFYYKVKNLDLEYNIQTVSYQTFINDWSLTFTLSIPKIFYDENQNHWEMLFNNIYFLKNSEKIHKLLKTK